MAFDAVFMKIMVMVMAHGVFSFIIESCKCYAGTEENGRKIIVQG